MAAVFVWTKRAGRVESGQRMIDCLKSVIYGFLIGIVNIIPGVSGGSMALALGIYERLISAVGCFGIGTIKVGLGLLRFNNQSKQKFADEWQRVEGTFLTCIAVGGATGAEAWPPKVPTSSQPLLASIPHVASCNSQSLFRVGFRPPLQRRTRINSSREIRIIPAKIKLSAVNNSPRSVAEPSPSESPSPEPPSESIALIF